MSSIDHPVSAPAAYVPQTAMAFGSRGSAAVAVDADHPLPIEARVVGARSAPLTGTASASGLAGPFVPDLGRPIWVTLSGSWTGKVTVKRATDGGSTRLPLTLAGGEWGVFTANANEIVGEESVMGGRWYLDITLTGGTLTYEVRQ